MALQEAAKLYKEAVSLKDAKEVLEEEYEKRNKLRRLKIVEFVDTVIEPVAKSENYHVDYDVGHGSKKDFLEALWIWEPYSCVGLYLLSGDKERMRINIHLEKPSVTVVPFGKQYENEKTGLREEWVLDIKNLEESLRATIKKYEAGLNKSS